MLAVAPALQPARGGTKLVLLGTGTPIPDPARSGPAVAVAVGPRPFLVDAGPGLVRRAAAASASVPALAPERLDTVFLTHLHSDHTVGLPDLIHTPWVVGRRAPLRVYGPPGTQDMVDHLVAAWSADRRVRTGGREKLPPEGGQIVVREISEAGEVFRDEYLAVTAIAVPHGTWKHAWAYRFDTADRSIVISGDTAASDTLADACSGCDLLVHEVFSAAAMEWLGDPGFAAYHGTFHTSTTELGRLAERARPGKLVLYHQLHMGATDEQLLAEVRAVWDGDVVSGADLDVF